MKKTVLSFIVALIMILSIIPCGVSAMWDGTSYATPLGDGSELNPYTINSEAELAGFAKMVNDGDTLAGKFAVLEADIDLGEYNWTPIGVTTAFSGTFDGKGHTVTGLKVETTENNAGLFGLLKDGTIKNLNVNGAKVSGTKYAAPVVANVQVTPSTGKSNIINCHTEGGQFSGQQIGGILGRTSTTNATTDQITVEYCSASDMTFDYVVSADATAASNVFIGGIAGASGSSVIRYCWSENMKMLGGGNVTGNISLGGLVGIQGASSAGCNIENCYVINPEIKVADTTTTAAAKVAIGGLIGRAGNTDTECEVQNCFVIGAKLTTVDGFEMIGALMGHIAKWVKFNNCYTDSDKNIGVDSLLIEYPVSTLKADELGFSGAVEKFNLNFGSSKAVWKDDTVAGHPVIDESVYAENEFKAVSYDELATETTAAVTTAAVTTSAEVTTSTETAADVTTAEVTAAEITTAPVSDVTTSAPEQKTGCKSSFALAGIVITVIGSALLIKKKD